VRHGARDADRLVLDLDPPEGAPFADVVRAARLVEAALADAGLAGAVKTSGAKGLHIVVPVAPLPIEDAAAATRALAARAERVDPAAGTTAYIREDREGKVFLDSTRAGGATLVAAYSPRARPACRCRSRGLGRPRRRRPGRLHRAHRRGPARRGRPVARRPPRPQVLPADLLEEGRAIPVARVAAMHEGSAAPAPAVPEPARPAGCAHDHRDRDIRVVADRADEFPAAVREGLHHVSDTPGFRSARLTRSIETPHPVRAAHRVGLGGGAHRGVPRVRALRAVARCRRSVLRRAAARRARRRRHGLLLSASRPLRRR
jgi:hypothetical protein